MVDIYLSEIDAQVSVLPTEEAAGYFEGSEPGENVIEITLGDVVTLNMPEEDAEDLYNALAVHFMGDKR
jgi:hypothetical protein